MANVIETLAISGVIVAAFACGEPTPTATKAQPSASAASSGLASPRSSDPFAQVRRPLVVPSSSPACPLLTAKTVSDAFGPVLGDGPVYPVAGRDNAYSVSRDAARDGWYPIKVLWVARKEIESPVLIRARALRGGQEPRFMDSPGAADSELQIGWAGETASEWREWASYTWVADAGCYQWQVDTVSATAIIPFEVAITSS